jgi:hypothetical protein
MAQIEFQDLEIFTTGIDGSDFLLFGQGGNQVPANPTREDFQLKLDTLYSYMIDRFNRNDKYEIGDIKITQNSSNPSAKYGGVWALIQSETILMAGGASEVGSGSVTPLGSNAPLIPVPAHSHGATIGSTDLGTKASTPNGNHSHTPSINTSGNTNPNGQAGYISTAADQYQRTTSAGITLSASGDHQHSVAIGAHSHSATIASAGVDGATLDVRGQRIYVYIWKKIA